MPPAPWREREYHMMSFGGKMGDKVEEKLKAENEKQKRKGKWKMEN
jgi:hypothetical protein